MRRAVKTERFYSHRTRALLHVDIEPAADHVIGHNLERHIGLTVVLLRRQYEIDPQIRRSVV